MKESEKASHTPEPWLLEDAPIPLRIFGKFGTITCTPYGHSINSHIANGRRIVACVNACAGFTTAELEDHGTGGLKQWMDDADETLKAVCDALEDVDYSGRCEQGIYALKQQRDELQAKCEELLAALERAHEELRDNRANPERMWSLFSFLSSFIAKHRGQHD